MPKQNLNDQQVAEVLYSVFANWRNNKVVIQSEMVMAMRK
jgi:hypothetical protein